MKITKRFATLGILCAVALSAGLTALIASTPHHTQQQSAPNGASSRVEYGSFASTALGQEMKFAIHLPPSYDKDVKRRYPVLYFLHGLNGNEGEYERRGVAAAVDKLREAGKIGEMIVVAPAGGNSFYLNSKSGVRYEDAIIKDLIPHIEKSYRAVGKPSGRAIQGLSMGGFGAMMLAFKHPEMFSSVTAHSSALFAELPKATGSDRRSQFLARMVGNLFGEPPDDEFFKANNPIDLAESNAAAIKKTGLKIYFDVGEQDRYGFQESNKVFDERLKKVGIEHEFHLFPGGHGWEYMIGVAENSYSFLWKNLKVDGKK